MLNKPLKVILVIMLSVATVAILFNLDDATNSENPLQEVSIAPTKTFVDDTPSSLSFSVSADFSTSAEAVKVLQGMAQSKSDFAIALGDLGYSGVGNEHEWCNLAKQHLGETYPFEIIAGNHDNGSKDGDLANYIDCLPNNFGGLAVGEYGSEYYFDIDQTARFIMVSPAISNYGYDYFEGDEHYQWVSDAVDEARKKDIDWVILGMHKNCITPGVKVCDMGPDLTNLALSKKVDVILQGHEHAYFRSKQLTLSAACASLEPNIFNEQCIAAEGDKFKKGEGTIIQIVGTGGTELRPIPKNDKEAGYYEAFNGLNTGKSHGFSVININETGLSSKFVPVNDGSFFDSFTISNN